MKKGMRYLCAILASGIISIWLCGCQDDEFGNRELSNEGFTISAISEHMLEQQVTTRSAIAKDAEEGKINHLYLFFFDENGQYLQTVDEQLFKGYWSPGEGETVMNIPEEALPTDGTAESVKVYALANIATEALIDEDGDGFPDFKISTGNTPEERLLNYLYDPGSYVSYNREDITQLPADGMPMFGESVNRIDLTQERGTVTIELKALMARIDVNITIDSEHSNSAGTLPRLSMAEWWVTNMPTAVPLTIPTGESDIVNHKVDIDPISNNEVITNHNGTISLSFYMFENLQNPAKSVPDGGYPTEGITEDDKQRWKPLLANENATAFHMRAYYSTYNDVGGNATYEATFTFYLGADHTSDFKVGRNRHYKNDITITGLTQVGTNPDHITFDARVNITEQNNPFFISMLRERDHDAHFCVTPMDVYLFNANPQMTVSINDPDNHKWIRMEKIPAEYMETGSVPPDLMQTNLSSNGEKYHSGNGKRRYFTTDLVTATLANNISYEVNHRDRIYFYVDENVSTSDRSATINIAYHDDDGVERTRSIEIVQHGLLKVIVPDDPDTWLTDETQTIYVEAYEEYLDHYDPLNTHSGDGQIYDGLYWSLTDFYMGGWLTPDSKWTEVYYNGDEATEKIIDETGDYRMDLNEQPSTAAEYCYNKNKRNANGEVGEIKWFLPGIRQLEAILTACYNSYPEIRECFYWSSSAAKRDALGREDQGRARATKALSGTEYAGSDHDEWYDESAGNNSRYGNADRQTYLRIRAAYIGVVDEN